MSQALKQKGIDAANAFTDFVNGASQASKEAFVEAMMREHRTLQQESFDLMLGTIGAWAKVPDNMVDARNSGAVRLSKMIADAIDKPIDYPVSNIRFTLDAEIEVGTTFTTERDTVDGVKLEWWEFTEISLIRVMKFVRDEKEEKEIVVDGRAKRIFK